MTDQSAAKPISVLIAALGGEGGGVLSGWLAAAAGAEGLPVQSTSIPGVAQRTGATTYYVEIFPVSWEKLGNKVPILALSPTPGNLDIMVATEFLEAARAIENGWITPENTKLIASTHRAYSILERSAMADGRYDSNRIHAAIRERSHSAVMFDMDLAAKEAGSMLSPVVLGSIARAGGLPIKKETFQAVIKASGIAIENNLRGFEAGFDRALEDSKPRIPAAPSRQTANSNEALLRRAAEEYSEPVKTIALNGVKRLLDYQGRKYAKLYLDRLDTVAGLDQAAHGWKLTAEVARLLALRMSYEDIIRVADLKTRAERADRVRQEVKAKSHEPVVTTEFLKPGLE
jgi:indolepyruvate ferredoxin oxidoreductase beta subunit